MFSPIRTFSDYQEVYERSVADPEGFWAEQAQRFQWKKPFDSVLEWDFKTPKAHWFTGGRLNLTENCLDRHIAEGKGDTTAFIWEPNDPKEAHKKFTYREVYHEVCRTANALRSIGVGKGDRVCLYLPMVPELAFSVLACARIGAIHSVVFAGFSATSLADRINDAEARVVLTADGGFRGLKVIDLKAIVDEALEHCPSVEHCVVLTRTGGTGDPVHMKKGRDIPWKQFLKGQKTDCKPEVMDSEDALFILYTSGSTGKPKGVVHTTAGYMVYTAYTFEQVFQYKPGQVFFCTADIGWITGHSYVVYAPLLCGGTSVMFEGVPTYPDAGRFWAICDKHQVNIFYTAPTAIRALEAQGLSFVEPYKLDSLKVLGSVGEPINEEAWHWYHKHIGKERCPIADTWWQTETGGFMISPIAHVTPQKPAFATLPLPGVQPVLVDNDGKVLEGNSVEGNLCIKFPWPSIIRTTWGDHDRCKQTYFATFPGYYFTGDGARRDEDGYYRIIGRVDDVLNCSGHRLGTAEVESAINEHSNVIESAVVGYPHEIKGQGIYAYVICEEEPKDIENLRHEILQHVTRVIGPIAKPDLIQVVPGLPKTRSGKIMRRILRKIAEGDATSLGDTSTLLDPEVVQDILDGALVQVKR